MTSSTPNSSPDQAPKASRMSRGHWRGKNGKETEYLIKQRRSCVTLAFSFTWATLVNQE